MSGGISFSDKQYWGKAGWVYRAVLASICKALDDMQLEDDFGLLHELSDECGHAQTIEFIDADRWEFDKVTVLIDAIRLGYRICVQEGPKDWNKPEYFPVFLKGYDELVELTNSIKT